MTNATDTDTARYCLDGCGQQVSGRASYRPGHDAAHVSALVTQASKHNFDQEHLDGGLEALGSSALRQKYVRAFNRAHDRMLAKQERATARAARKVDPTAVYRFLDATGTVKAGRWDYPARRWIRPETSEFWRERNEKRDGSGAWIDTADGSDVLDNEVVLEGRDRIREDISAWASPKAA